MHRLSGLRRSRHVTFMDSSGLAVLIAAHNRALARAVECRIANAAPNLERVFQITGLDCVLLLVPT